VHFDHDFVQTHFPGDLAFSSVTLDGQWRASSRHSLSDTKLSCSGTDGEIHIGAYEDAIDLPTNQRPFSRLAGLPTVAWGLVAEPPNATADDSTLLKDREGSRITFEGYSRVWNEGHYDDEKHKNPNGSSNPNHLLELHPIWKIDAASDSHEDYEFQSTVPAKRYAGYGMLKAGPMLQEISAKAWPLAYSTGGQLFVSLAEESNFYQLPVRITGVQTAPAAVILHADVCAAVGCSGGGVAYRNLRIVARVDSFGQKPFTSGEVTELLGIFSVHLGKAEQLSSHATSAQSAVAVPEALEFFVFARTKERAVRNSKCDPE
jgi:hypothetical protein